MDCWSLKGHRRLKLDLARVQGGEPRANWKKNREVNGKYPKGGQATRKRGRDRFKTGKKRQKRGKR